MSNPNPEQKLAIEHHGGVLLKAGAGSGKTFVLIEHIKFLVDQWIIEFKESGQEIDQFRANLKSKFNKIVLMTFTKMAAGEISIRLFNRFNEQKNKASSERAAYWEIASDLVDSISVSTIHGFCFKLIKQGLLKNVDAHDEMLDDVEFKSIIEKLFDQWIALEIEQKKENINLIELMVKDREHLIKSLQDIIGDPSLRIMWRNVKSNHDTQMNEEDHIWTALFEEHADLTNYALDTQAISKFSGKNWADYLMAFYSHYRGPVVSRELAKYYLDFFQYYDFKVPRSPTAKAVDESIKTYYGHVKTFAGVFKTHGKDFVHYFEYYEEIILEWFGLFQKLVQYVDQEYSRTPGLTFADLEFLVWNCLHDPETVTRVAENYHYFIIDEFQDTSYIQFEIIEKLIQNDFSRLFCVGDVKQAIYGFRGGELGVFLECQSKTNQVLSLKNNYRSLANIINFNNHFFEFLFERGIAFEGSDPHSVEVEHQSVPDSTTEQGIVYPMLVDVKDNGYFSDEEKVSNREIEFLEALRLLEQIKFLRLNNQPENICVLYKRLKPSLALIYQLIENEIGFTAQIKVPYATDPVVGIFSTLIQQRFDTNQNKMQFSNILIQKYLEILGHEINYDLNKFLNEFELQEEYFGLYQAYLNLLTSLGIANSNYANNLLQIESLINLAGGDVQKLQLLLEESSDNSYSMNFQIGKDPQKVIIMTAHASKGLQFDHVLLGGLYTNDSRMPYSPLFGKIPLSLQWSLKLEGKKRFKTPQYIYEKQLANKKDFSESKRLFYVACTRAKKSLGWVNIPLDKYKMKTPQKGAWIQGLQKWTEHLDEKQIFSSPFLSPSIEEAVEFDSQKLLRLENTPPLFHIDSLGNTPHICNNQQLMPIAELSVTRLAAIADCPRKFYLKNICKIADVDLEMLKDSFQISSKEHLLDESSREISLDSEENLTSSSFLSNANRGSVIHEKLSEIIKTDLNSYDVSKEIQRPVDWAVENLKKYVDNYELISEKSIKFELFGHMISGIPDLYLTSKTTRKLCEVWDFKTGKWSQDKENSYWLQLYSYAYAAYSLGLTSREKQIRIVLCYVDQQKILDRNISFVDVEKYLVSFWEQIMNPWQTNSEHCSQCSYQLICQS